MREQRHWKWLSLKIPEWVDREILTSEQARRLMEEAPVIDTGRGLLPRILIAISALLIGLGVVSFFAFNWQAMPKWLKLTTVFTAFIAAHGAGGVYGRKPERKILSEFLHLLGTLFFGSGIILIAQIYHINDHFPNGVLLWSAGALLMAYVLDSTPQMLIYAVLIVVWQALERSYDLPQIWALGYAGAAMLPFAMLNRHWFIVSISSAAMLIVTAIQLSYYPIGLNGSLFFLGALCLGAAMPIRRTAEASMAVPFEIYGNILYLAMLISLSFSGGVKVGLLEGWSTPEVDRLYFPGAVITMAGVIWAWALLPFRTLADRLRHSLQWQTYMAFPGYVIAAAIWLIAHSIDISGSRSDLALIGMVLFNVLAVIHGLALIFAGTRAGRVGLSFLGCLLVVTIILSRFMAFSDDLLIRSAAFTFCGAFILIIALKTSSIKKGQVSDANV